MAQVSPLVDTLKASLKAAGIKYTQVASTLQLSESSIKRKFSRKEFTLSELDRICALAGMQISDLVRRMEEGRARLQALTREQEEEIAGDHGLLLVAVSILNRWSFEQLLDFYHFESTELVQLLARLDRLKMIELLPNNRIKLLVAPNFGWLPNGPIEQVFLAAIQKDFFSTRFDREDQMLLVLNGMLSPASNREFQRKMERLAREFDQLNSEDAGLPLGKKHGCTVLLALRDWHYQTFAHLRRERA
ncbi:MAG: helix-turn-helix transcriptional regulator [Halieaceae bacterium]|nr:helix-turn-helix transcriptional regulator [Halieaceae bacterium]